MPLFGSAVYLHLQGWYNLVSSALVYFTLLLTLRISAGSTALIWRIEKYHAADIINILKHKGRKERENIKNVVIRYC
jgi:hypothetical protein